MKKVKFKKGTTVELFCCTHDMQSEEYEDYTLEVDMTEDELNKIAEDFFWNTKEPEWGFRKPGEHE
jgi:hypothetical protein